MLHGLLWRVQKLNDDSSPALQQTSHKATQKHASHSHGLFTKITKLSIEPWELDDRHMT